MYLISHGAEPAFVGLALVRAKKLSIGVFFGAESDFFGAMSEIRCEQAQNGT